MKKANVAIKVASDGSGFKLAFCPLLARPQQDDIAQLMLLQSVNCMKLGSVDNMESPLRFPV